MLLLTIGVIVFVVLYQKRVIYHQLQLASIEEEKQRDLIAASIKGEEEERKRIASELHDDVGATLSSVRLLLANITPDGQGLLQESRTLLNGTLEKVRLISHRLHPAMVHHLGIDAALKALTDNLTLSGAIAVIFHPSTYMDVLSHDEQLSLYRIVQELLTNLIKHASASSVTISSEQANGHLILTVIHNGIGITEDQYQTSLQQGAAIGLKSIAHRLQSIHATILFTKQTNGNYKIVVSVPLKL